jgi:hypothetical protein
MTFVDDILTAIRSWLNSMVRDAAYSHSKTRVLLAGQIRGLPPISTLTEAKTSLTSLRAFVRLNAATGEAADLHLKVLRRCNELLCTINGLLSRVGYSVTQV